MKTHIACFLIGLVALAAHGAERTEEFRCFLEDCASITIDNVAGSVRITPWENEDVYLKATLQERVESVQFRCEEKSLFIGVKLQKKRGNRTNAHLELFIPQARLASLRKLDVTTVSADATVAGCAGELRMKSASGDVMGAGNLSRLELTSISGTVRFEGVADQASVESASGDIELKADMNRLDASSVSGSVRVDGTCDRAHVGTTSGDILVNASIRDLTMGAVSGTLRATRVVERIDGSTVSGDIHVQGGDFRDAELGSMSGTIRFGGRLASDAKLDISTQSGDIVANVPADTPARINARTHSGDIRCGFPGTKAVENDQGPGSSLVFESADPSRTIALSSHSGTIRLDDLKP